MAGGAIIDPVLKGPSVQSYETIGRSPAAVKVAALLICVVVLAWFIKSCRGRE